MTTTPRIQQRPIDETLYRRCLEHGLEPLLARIAAARLTPEDDLERILNPRLQMLQTLDDLANVREAGELIANAILDGKHIVIATDYDADGITAAWVIVAAFRDHFGLPSERYTLMINERAHGYGLNATLTERILQQHARQPVGLVITADQGASDETQIARLKAAGIPVCVTDHHHFPDSGPPASAACVVNPQLNACRYDNQIAGCMVAFLVMSQVRRVLIERGHLPADAPSLKPLLPQVALGTIADSVSLKSPNNRAVVLAGLRAINQLQHPVWQAVQRFTRTRAWMDPEFLAFEVATRLNAASRVNDVRLAFEFLDAPTVDAALAALRKLEQDNRARKQQQQTLLEQAREQAAACFHADRFSLALHLKGPAGLQGIVAQRIGEQYHRPTVAFTDLGDGTLAGSGRSIIDGLDLRGVFQWMEARQPGLFLTMGGHRGAAGCTIARDDFERFEKLLEAGVRHALQNQPPQAVLLTDGALAVHQLHPGIVQLLNTLAPYGQGWPAPLFDNCFEVLRARILGRDRRHLAMTLRMHPRSRPFDALFFHGQLDTAETALPRFQPGQWIRAVYRPVFNQFAGRQQFQLRIVHAEPAEGVASGNTSGSA